MEIQNRTFKYGEYERLFDVTHPKSLELYEKAQGRMQEKLNETAAMTPASKAFAQQIKAIQVFFDDVLGPGASAALVGDDPSVADVGAALTAFVAYTQAQVNGTIAHMQTVLAPAEIRALEKPGKK